MAKWECIVCGWIYDEVTGDPDSGIAPGTQWEDIPEDWLCPDCGVGKEDFELIDAGPAEEPEAEDEANLKPVVIIGTGLAGYNLVKEMRKADKDIPIIMLTSDDGRNYSKPMLSTGFTRNNSADDLMMADAGKMALQFDISVWTNTTVNAINTEKQLVTTTAGVQIEYSSLVLAWGAGVIRPPIEGDASDSIFSCNDLVDYAAFRSELTKRKAKKVVIVGGGLIGCEFTNDLLNGEFDVETVDPLGYCLPTLLPEAAGKAVQRALEEKGATFHFGPVVTEVNKKDHALAVTLDNGTVLDADIVVSAVGVRPRLALAEQAGIGVNRGIVANRLLETSANNVYTLGDCAEVEGNVLFYVAPLMACARALAKTLTGTPTPVSYPAMPVTIKTPACPVVVAPVPRDAEGDWAIQEHGNDVIAEFRNPQGELLGFALTGKGTSQKLQLQKELPPMMA